MWGLHTAWQRHVCYAPLIDREATRRLEYSHRGAGSHTGALTSLAGGAVAVISTKDRSRLVNGSPAAWSGFLPYVTAPHDNWVVIDPGEGGSAIILFEYNEASDAANKWP
ncbi:MAG: hypothetical protein FWG10_03880 [Eubacteriaceae bacterium]|nr:hypothetical protein [Eubacteriaceae bacterium]